MRGPSRRVVQGLPGARLPARRQALPASQPLHQVRRAQHARLTPSAATACPATPPPPPPTCMLANCGSTSRSANSMYAPGTSCVSPPQKQYDTRSATVLLCSSRPSGDACSAGGSGGARGGVAVSSKSPLNLEGPTAPCSRELSARWMHRTHRPVSSQQASRACGAASPW